VRAEKRDANEPAIVAAFEALQCLVWRLCKDEPADLLVLISGAAGDRLRLIEIKDPAKPPSARRLTPTQKATHRVWPVHIIETVEQVEQLCGYARLHLRRATGSVG